MEENIVFTYRNSLLNICTCISAGRCACFEQMEALVLLCEEHSSVHTTCPRAGAVCRTHFKCRSSKIVVGVVAGAQYCGACTCLSQKTKPLSMPCEESSPLVSKPVFLLQVIKARVKELMIPRYKIVVVIHIGQLNEQSMQIGSRCLWDPESDTFSSYVFKNASLFALANVYAIYFE